MTACNIKIYESKREKIFRNLEYDPITKKIYNSCDLRPVGESVRGKIKWYKK